MFTCNECHKKSYGTDIRQVHFFGSTGPCEWCRKVGPCADCHCNVPIERVAANAEKIRAKFRKKR